MVKALIIVDVQNDFLPGGALAIKEGDIIIPFINKLQGQFDVVLATKDWHPKDHISFGKRGDYKMVQGQKQELWPPHCIQGTFGAEFSNQLETKKIAKVFYKGSDPNIDSYSAFFDNAHLRSTGLTEYLKEKKINEIVLVGLATDFCVKFSVLDARRLGFEVSVYLQGCKGIELKEGDIQRSIDEMMQVGAHIIR